MELCGKCLHERVLHTEHNGHFMYCSSCMKLCDKDEFQINHSPSNYVIQDGVKVFH